MSYMTYLHSFWHVQCICTLKCYVCYALHIGQQFNMCVIHIPIPCAQVSLQSDHSVGGLKAIE